MNCSLQRLWQNLGSSINTRLVLSPQQSFLITHFQMLARYNTLANQRLYDACAQLADTERKRVRPAFFKSIHGTLNHILVGDRIWMTRFQGQTIPSTGLDAILYEDFAALRTARMQEDARIEEFFGNLNVEFLDITLSYINNQNRQYEDSVSLLVAHFFNHQTHHRGQIHDMLSQTPIVPPSLDMHRVLNP